MECHYDVLGISRNADADDIKYAYRKLALEWHPDKNLDKVELAKERFQIIKRAYEILSDGEERACYDNIQEEILRDSYSKFVDNRFDVSQYLTTMCFKGYGDDENGFYSVYRTVFDCIIKEDIKLMEGKRKFRDVRVPRFGYSSTDYQEVSEFYAYWLNYSTKKDYAWLNIYETFYIQDPEFLKVAEIENKKIRDFARKQHNRKVQNLVAFVREKDERVIAQKRLQEQKLAEEKKRGELRSRKQKMLNDFKYQRDWSKFVIRKKLWM
nr:dnaJ homolog subfamily C member 21-like [Leptinotarsa decemlineata]